jgi:UDP-2,3-diacylglucosamine pyrophosphatase LpxH
MLYNVISDLHIDRGDGPFTLNGGPAALNSFLDFAWNDPIIYLGDSLELWANSFSEIWRGPNQPLVSRLMNHPDYRVVLGNHDASMKLFPKIYTQLQVGNRTLTHGHTFDKELNTEWKCWTAEEADRIATELDNSIIVDGVARWLQSSNNTSSEDDIIEAIQDTGKNFIFGHTHRAAYRTLRGGGIYVNCGSWCEGPPYNYIEIDDSGNAVLKKWRG